MSAFSSAEEEATPAPFAPAMTALLFQEPDVARARPRRRKVEPPVEVVEPVEEEVREQEEPAAVEPEENSVPETSRRKRGSRGRRKASETTASAATPEEVETESEPDKAAPEAEAGEVTTRRRRRRRSSGAGTEASDEVTAPKGSTRLEAKRQRRKEGREAGRRRHTVTESEYLARRESVKRDMLVREQDGLNQIAVLEDDVLVEHYVARHTQVSMVGNVYLGRVQNVLPSMEAAFVDIGKGRNAVLYAGEVNWEAAGLEGKPRRIEQALKSGDTVLVQVTKDPIGHKGARLTAQITLAGRHLVLVPSGAMTGISRKLPEKERQRLKKLLREIVPSEHGVIVRTAAEGASEEQLRADVERLTKAWDDIQEKSKAFKSAPTLLKGEPELALRVVRDIFNEDFATLKVQGNGAWQTLSEYVGELSPELSARLSHWTSDKDIFAEHRVDEQLAKAFDRKVWLPSGGTLIVDRTEAMTVVDVNTGKFTGSGGTLEETVTRNNLEAAEEIVRQLRLRDIGGIIVVDFIDMVLESNRDLVLRRLIECLGRDRTRHQVAEVTSLGLVQMTRKRVGQGLVEAFSTPCEECEGKGYMLHTHPVERSDGGDNQQRRGKKNTKPSYTAPEPAPAPVPEAEAKRDGVKAALNSIAAAAGKAHEAGESGENKAGERRGTRNARKTRERGGRGAQDETSRAKTEDTAKSAAGGESEPARDAVVESAPKSSAPKSADTQDVRHSTEVVKTSYRGKTVAKVESKPAALLKAASLPVGKVDSGTSASAEASGAAEKPARRTRRVVSSGTITPGSGTILSFPAK
ncbi:MAG: Rne/Rng family ribonuclease [Ancrocorticia sp.]